MDTVLFYESLDHPDAVLGDFESCLHDARLDNARRGEEPSPVLLQGPLLLHSRVQNYESRISMDREPPIINEINVVSEKNSTMLPAECKTA